MDKEIYDFYYSEQNEAHARKFCSNIDRQYYCTYINGIKYTEAIKIGRTPVTAHFGDINKVYTGTFKG